MLLHLVVKGFIITDEPQSQTEKFTFLKKLFDNWRIKDYILDRYQWYVKELNRWLEERIQKRLDEKF